MKNRAISHKTKVQGSDAIVIETKPVTSSKHRYGVKVVPYTLGNCAVLKSNPHLIIQVNDGTTDICQSSRPIKQQERAAFRAKYQREVVEVKVALDAIGVYVNEANPANELSLPQMRALVIKHQRLKNLESH